MDLKQLLNIKRTSDALQDKSIDFELSKHQRKIQ